MLTLWCACCKHLNKTRNKTQMLRCHSNLCLLVPTSVCCFYQAWVRRTMSPECRWRGELHLRCRHSGSAAQRHYSVPVGCCRWVSAALLCQQCVAVLRKQNHKYINNVNTQYTHTYVYARTTVSMPLSSFLSENPVALSFRRFTDGTGTRMQKCHFGVRDPSTSGMSDWVN